MDPYSKVLMDFQRQNPTSYNSIRNTQITPVTLGALKPSDAIAQQTMKAQPQLQSTVKTNGWQNFGQALFGQFSNNLSDKASELLFGKGNTSEFGRSLGTMFSTGINSAGNKLFSNIIKGDSLLSGLKQNTTSALAGAGVGLASNYLGQGIAALGGDSKLSRGIGAGVSTIAGTWGGNTVSKLLGAGAGAINPYGLAASALGNALGAGIGPSKEYGGKYGNVTQTLDTAYDGITAAVNAIP